MPKVLFVPLGKSRDIKSGSTILAAANQCGVPIGQSCSGEGLCGWCKVRIVAGAENMAPPGDLERKLIKEKAFDTDERAACLAKVRGDIAVTTSYW
ncbi:(2Fe-2S)-binding protein [bacterium]|nr:MAG: (2Fe-2S)-binding protein [bacterium]